MKDFNELKVGDVAKIQHKISSDDLKKFVEITGDDNRLHTDADFAAKTSFKKPVVHGMLCASFISTIIGTKLPGDGALWLSQNLDFLLPVRVGDALTISAEVINKDDRLEVVELKTNVTNQHRQLVVQGIAKVKLIKQDRTLIMSSTNVPKKIALVIGGSGGIGAAASLALAAAGYDVAVHYFKNVNSAQNVAAQIRATGSKVHIWSCDITDSSAVDEMVKEICQRLGYISVLVNCATSKIAAIKFPDLIWNDFELHMNTQILGAFNLIRSVCPFMESAQYGKIINITTQYVDQPEANLLPYIVSKGALTAFSKSLAIELAPKGIRVNMISPGMVETDQIADVPERVQLLTAANTPIRRLANPSDIANAVVFLASEMSDFLCGETIRINGGKIMI